MTQRAASDAIETGSGREARAMARNAADRSGKSLGEWLDGVVAAHASNLGVDVENLDSDQRLEIIAAKLGSLGAKAKAERNSQWTALQNRSETLRDSVSRRQWRDRDGDAQPTAETTGPEALAPTPRTGRRNVRDQNLSAHDELDAAIDLRERNARDRETRTAEALADVTHWIPRGTANTSGDRQALDVIADRLALIDRYIERGGDLSGYEPSRQTFNQLEDRIRVLAHAAETQTKLPAAQEGVLHDLGDRLTDLTDKIERLEQAGSPRERADHYSRFGSKLGGILSSLDRQLRHAGPEATKPMVEPAAMPHAPPRQRRPGLGRATSLDSMDNALAEIAKRQRSLDSGIDVPEAEPPSTPEEPRALADVPPAPRRELESGPEMPIAETPAAGNVSPVDIAAFDERMESIALRIERAMERADHPLAPAPLPVAAHTPALETMRQDIAAIGRSVAELTDASARSSASAVADIQSEIGRLAVRLENALSASREPEAELLRREIQEMSRVIADLASTNARKEAAGVAALQSEIAKLATQLGQPSRSEPSEAIQELRQDVSQMSERLGEVASRGSLAALEGAVRDLSQKVEGSRDDGLRAQLLAPVERLTNEMREALRDIDPRTTVDALDGEIRKMSVRLEEMGRRHVDADAVASIQSQTREIRDLLTSAAKRSTSLEHIEGRIGALGERLDEVAAARQPGLDLVAHANDIRALIQENTPVATLAALEQRVQGLAERIDDVLERPLSDRAIESINVRVERLQQTIAQQTANAIDTRGLEAMVERLTDSVEEFRHAGTDSKAIAALQSQIAQILSRLDNSEAHVAQMGVLERSMESLASRLQESHNAVAPVRAAVTDDTTAAEAVRPHVESIGRELAELRNMHDESDQRIHGTLSAMHVTLEKVVDRLAVLEDEQSRPPRQPVAAEGEREASGRLPEVSAPAMAPAAVKAAANAARAAAARADLRVDSPDFLIEPGSGIPPIRQGGKSRERGGNAAAAPGKAAEQPAASSFIAAARRAAQTAAAESAASKSRGRIRSEGDAAAANAGPSAVDQLKTFVAAKKRPLLLGVAGLVVLLGTYGIVRSLTSAQLEQPRAPAAAPAAAKKDVPQTNLAPLPPAGPGASAPAARSSSQLFDPTPTGSIATPGGIPRLGMGGANGGGLHEAALQGDASAQYEMGVRLSEGKQMARDLRAASQWFEKAAAQGLAPAQYRLGAVYEKGVGVPQDLTLAVAWYQRAAEAGNARAMHNLAVITAEGGANGKPNYATAVNWFRKAAALGVRDSQYNLAILTARGLGTSQDLAESWMWFSLAALQGDADAGKKRDELGKQLDAATLASAKARVEAFKPEPLDKGANAVAVPAGGWDAPGALNRGVQMPRAKISGL